MTHVNGKTTLEDGEENQCRHTGKPDDCETACNSAVFRAMLWVIYRCLGNVTLTAVAMGKGQREALEAHCPSWPDGRAVVWVPGTHLCRAVTKALLRPHAKAMELAEAELDKLFPANSTEVDCASLAGLFCHVCTTSA